MESLIGQLPFAGPIIAIVIVILGIAAGIYMLDGFRSKKKKEENDGEDRLITILEKTVRELGGKVKKQDDDIIALTRKVEDIEKENKTLREILQGRDGQTQEFYKRAFQAIETGQKTHDGVTTLVESMKINNENTTKLIGLLEKHLEVLDHTANK